VHPQRTQPGKTGHDPHKQARTIEASFLCFFSCAACPHRLLLEADLFYVTPDTIFLIFDQALHNPGIHIHGDLQQIFWFAFVSLA
jgi:hypothetical protein